MEEFKNIRYVSRGLAFLVAILFIVTILSTFYLSKTLIDTKVLIRDGSNTVAAALVLQDLELNLRAAESSQRGYIITGDAKHLESYYKAIKIIPEEQKALANPSYDIAADKSALLNNLLTRRLELMQRALEIRDTQGFEAAVNAISTNQGLMITNQIESLVQQITREKFEPFTSTIQETQNSLRLALVVAGIMIGFVLIISMLLMVYFQRSIARERATEGVKNEFLSLASHQLRTPASNVKQYLGLLLEGYLGKLKPEQKDAIQIANRNNDMGINIINDLLGVAKLDLDKIHIHKQPTNIYSLVKEVVEEHRPLLHERRQTVKFTRAAKKAVASVDPNYLKSVFENLMDNASKYSPKKSRITVSVEYRSKKIVVSIQDEGVGIKRTEKSKLFKKFSRIPSEHSSGVEGSGLGLYWVKQIVELHGGRISVKSKHGKGSTFIVEIPTD